MFVNGKKQGFGIMKLGERVYEGDWTANKINGVGRYQD